MENHFRERIGSLRGQLSDDLQTLLDELQTHLVDVERQNETLRRELHETRQRSEQELGENEQRFRALVTASSEMVYRMTPDWSEGLVLAAADLIADPGGPSRTWLQDYIPPDDQPRMTAAIEEAIRAKGVFELEHRVRRADGTVGWLFSRAIPLLGADGEIVEWFGSAADITKRKRAEEVAQRAYDVLDVAFEAADMGTWQYTFADNICEYDARARRLYGLQNARFLHDEPGARRLFHPGDIPAMWQAVQAARDPEGDGRYIAEYRVRRPEGGWRWLNAWGIVEFAGTGDRREPVCMIGASRDITDQKQAEQVLRDSEQYVRRVLNNLFAFVGVLTPEGIVLEANRAPLEAAGIRFEDVQGKPFEACYWWSYSPAVQERIRQAIDRAASGECSRFDVEARMAGGRLMTIDFMIAPMRDEEGRITHLIPSAVDIADRKRAEQALRESESFYRQTLESIPAMVFTTRPDGYCDYQSLPWADFTGVPMSEHLGDGWNKLLHPDDRARAYNAWRAAVEERAAYDLEYRVRRHDGQYEWFKVHARPIRNAAGEIVRWFGTALNIDSLVRAQAALRESEGKYRSLFESIDEGFCVIQMLFDDAGAPVDYRFLEINPALEKHTGMEGARGRTIRELVPDIEPFWPEVYGKVSLTGEPRRFEHHSEALQRWFDVYAFRIGRPEERKVAMLFRDVTERKHVEEELERARIAAEAANEAKSRFLASMSHELRTPMNAILGMTDLALEEPLSDRLRDYLQTARESGDLLLHLLDEVLDLSRIEAGQFELDASPFSPRQVTEQIARALRVRAREKGLDLRCELADDLPNLVLGDSFRLRQVLINLVGNAVKFTAQGWVAVRAGVHCRNRQSVVLDFSISDTGIGIAPEDRQRIFDPFTQADASTTRRYGGTGLGLAISRKLIALMGGTMGLESEPGQGSTFHFQVTLPTAAPAPEERPAALGDGTPFPEPAAAPARPLRVLLAEDTPANQKLVDFVLGSRGHTVVVAEDGREAVERLAAESFDVVLMDGQMPEMDGFQATAAIRALPDRRKARLPVIALTAHALKGDAQRCLAAGMDAYLSKPVDGRRLIALVEQLAEAASERDAPRSAGGVQNEPTPLPPSAQPERECRHGEGSSAEPPLFDLDEAVERCFGQHRLFQKMVDSLFQEAASLLDEMRAALAHGDREKLAAAAHRLKGTVVYLAAGPAAEAAARVEQIGRSGDLDTAPDALGQLSARLDALKAALAVHRSEDA